MNTVDCIPIQLELTTRSNPPVQPRDLNTDAVPRFYRGEDVQFNIAIFDPKGFCVDLSNLDFLQVSIFPYPIPPQRVPTNRTYSPYSFLPYPSVPPAPLLFQTVVKEDITALVSRASWLGGYQQQASVIFPWIDTQSLNLGGASVKRFLVEVTGLIGGALVSDGDPVTDNNGDPVTDNNGNPVTSNTVVGAVRKLTYGGGLLEVFESGAQGIYLPNSIAPLRVPEATIFYLPENAQLTFAVPIEVDGVLLIDGVLFDASAHGSVVPGVPVTDNDGIELTDNDGNVVTSNDT